MSHNSLTSTESQYDLSRFEKNRYFHGKLMTARDMEAEQNYTVGRQNLLTRNVLGEGLVCGLNVTEIVVSGNKLNVTLEPGLALDRGGNQLVVDRNEPVAAKKGSRGKTGLPDGNEIFLYLKFVECEKESVPIPHSENPCKEECCYNRTLETYDIFFEETDPAPARLKHVEELTFPTPQEVTADESKALGRIARSYYKKNRAACVTATDPVIFLGKWKQNSGGEWEVAEGEKDGPTDRPVPLNRPHVYNNDMLYAAISRHVIDYANPHNVTAKQTDALESVDGVGRDDGGNVDFVSDSDETISITPSETDHTVEFQTSAKQIDALESVDGVRRDDSGNVDFVSDPNETISITPSETDHIVEFQTSAKQIGAVETINHVSRDENGDIELTSRNGSLTITPNAANSTIDLSASIEGQQPELKCVDFDGFLPTWLLNCGPILDCNPSQSRTHFPLQFRGLNINTEADSNPTFIDTPVPAGLVKLEITKQSQPLHLSLLPDEDDEEAPLVTYAEVEVSFGRNTDNGARIFLEGHREGDVVVEDTTPLENDDDIPENDHTYRLRIRADEAGVDGFDFLSVYTHNSTAGLIEVCTRRSTET